MIQFILFASTVFAASLLSYGEGVFFVLPPFLVFVFIVDFLLNRSIKWAPYLAILGSACISLLIVLPCDFIVHWAILTLKQLTQEGGNGYTQPLWAWRMFQGAPASCRHRDRGLISSKHEGADGGPVELEGEQRRSPIPGQAEVGAVLDGQERQLPIGRRLLEPATAPCALSSVSLALSESSAAANRDHALAAGDELGHARFGAQQRRTSGR